MKIHHTFSDVSFNQTFPIGDILKKLEDLRRDGEKQLRDEENELFNNMALGNIVPCYPDSPRNLIHDLKETHNAYVVLQGMKKNIGMKEITLNPAKDLRHQILAMANPMSHWGKLFLPSEYQSKLTNG